MTKAIRALFVGSVGFLVTAAVVIGQAAPTPGDASLTVDQQIHLGSGSALVKEGSLLLWAGGTNTGIGSSAVSSNTSGTSNTGVGSGALASNTTGTFNTAVGDIALSSNYDGQRNTAVGAFSLTNNVTGSYNTALGLAAMEYNTSGSNNTAVGIGALAANVGEGSPYSGEGSGNTGVGTSALGSNQYGFNNTAMGHHAMEGATGGNWNTGIGSRALINTTGGYNTAVGAAAMTYNSTGSGNTAVGLDALFNASSGNENVALGNGALYHNSSGNKNIAVGENAGFNLGAVYPRTGASTYSHNIFIGNMGVYAEDQNLIRIGTAFDDQGDADASNDTGQGQTFIAGIVGVTTRFEGAVPVVIDSAGQLGTISSSRRYKEDIESMEEVSEKLLALRPVTFRFKEPFADGEKPIQFGLIAEEVAAVFPELVVHNEAGEPETVKYHLLSTLLLNELQEQAQVQARVNEEHARKLAELAALVEGVRGGT